MESGILVTQLAAKSGEGLSMARLSYTPDRGDLVHVNLSPSAGREITGPHYAPRTQSKNI